jgi:hypothetical protein
MHFGDEMNVFRLCDHNSPQLSRFHLSLSQSVLLDGGGGARVSFSNAGLFAAYLSETFSQGFVGRLSSHGHGRLRHAEIHR